MPAPESPQTVAGPGSVVCANQDRPAPGGTETILVVEDHDEVRRLIGEVLGRAGYTVIVAPDGSEALGILAAAVEPISLLLTDVVMPGISGPELAGICLERCPGLRVLYMSGYGFDAVGEQGSLGPDLAFIQKPFASVDLLKRVRAVLDTPSPLGVCLGARAVGGPTGAGQGLRFEALS